MISISCPTKICRRHYGGSCATSYEHSAAIQLLKSKSVGGCAACRCACSVTPSRHQPVPQRLWQFELFRHPLDSYIQIRLRRAAREGQSPDSDRLPQSSDQSRSVQIHTVLTDSGIQFADLLKNRLGPTARWRPHMFDMLCDANSIELRLTKPSHPWTNGQVETDEPNPQRGDRATLPLQHAWPTQSAHPRLPDGL